MKTLAFFNNKGGVGKTSLVYHLAWMFASRGVPVLAVDLDPQANLTSMFLDENELSLLWPEHDVNHTIYGAIQPMMRGIGDIAPPQVLEILPNLRLLAGDLGLSRFEDKLSEAWGRCQLQDEAALRITTAFHRVIRAASVWGAELVLVDVSPSLGAINRAALLAADHLCVPLNSDLFSLQSLRNLGPTLRLWRDSWSKIRPHAPRELALPKGQLNAIGYVLTQHGACATRPMEAYQTWMEAIPASYQAAMTYEAHKGQARPATMSAPPSLATDPQQLAVLKRYQSLMPMAMAAHKPMFFLRHADGAVGAHMEAVRQCYADFDALAKRIAERLGIRLM